MVTERNVKLRAGEVRRVSKEEAGEKMPGKDKLHQRPVVSDLIFLLLIYFIIFFYSF